MRVELKFNLANLKDRFLLNVKEDLTSFSMHWRERDEFFNLKFEEGTVIVSDYEGPYVVIPAFHQITLGTEAKTLSANVEVLRIPTSQTHNDAGGLTFII